jgi:hypothetical protein
MDKAPKYTDKLVLWNKNHESVQEELDLCCAVLIVNMKPINVNL